MRAHRSECCGVDTNSRRGKAVEAEHGKGWNMNMTTKFQGQKCASESLNRTTQVPTLHIQSLIKQPSTFSSSLFYAISRSVFPFFGSVFEGFKWTGWLRIHRLRKRAEAE
jgi:hypothetical protein